MCHALAKEGASIVVVDKNKDGADITAGKLNAAGIKAISIKADVQAKEELEAMANCSI